MNRVLKIILFVLVLIALVSTASYCSAPYDTETAHIITVKKSLEANGYILRRETLVKNASGGIFEPYIKDGTRVARGSSLGIFTEGNLDKQLVTKLEDVTKRINDIKDATSFAEVYSSDEARIYSAMHDLSVDIRHSTLAEDYPAATDSTVNLNALISKKHSLENADASDKLLVSLEEEKYNLENQLGGIRKEVSSPASGYFYTTLDGLEGYGAENDITALTVTDIDSFATKMEEAALSGYSGKVVDSYIWYVAASVASEEAAQLTAGDTVTVSLDGSVFVKATVLAVNADKAGYSAVILKSDRSIPGVYEKRTVQIEICIAEHTGFYVPSAAIRVKDGVTGVYVMNKANSIDFRCVKIIYEDEDYYIAKSDYEPSEDCPFSPLANYDNILVNPEVVSSDRELEK